MTVELINRSGVRLPLRRLGRTTRRIIAALERRGRSAPGPRKFIVAFVSDRESRRLNRRFLKKSRPADVLSFDYGTVAELVLAPRFVRNRARSSGIALPTALERLIGHGAMHLAGLHHEESRRAAKGFEEFEADILKQAKVWSG